MRAQIDTTYNGNIQAKQSDVPPMYDVKTDWRCVFNYDGGTATSTFGGNGRLQEAGRPHSMKLIVMVFGGLSPQGSDRSPPG